MLIVRGLTVLLAGISGQCWGIPVSGQTEAARPQTQPAEKNIEVTTGWELEPQGLPEPVPGQVWARPDIPRSLSESGRLGRGFHGGLLGRRDQQCDDSVPVACSRDGEDTEILCSGCSTCCSGEGRCCGQGMRCCTTSDGFPSCCPIAVDNSSGSLPAGVVATVFATTTVTQTATRFTETRTSVVISTRSVTLTFIDPGELTQTSTITSTSFIGGAVARQATQIPLPLPTFDNGRPSIASSTKLRRQDDAADRTITSTLTIDTTTTVFEASTVFTTIFNTIFVSTTIAPNAITTVFTTTTIFTTPGLTSSSTTSHSGGGESTSGSSPTSTVLPPPPPPPPPSSSAISPEPTSQTVIPPPVSSSVPPPPPPPPEPSTITLPPTMTIVIPPTLPPSTPPPPVTSSSLSSIPPESSSSAPPSSLTTETTPGASSGTTPGASSGTGTMETMMTSTRSGSILPPGPTSTSTPPVTPHPGSPLTSDQIAGIALGVIFFIFLLLLAAYLLRRLVQRRRRKLASIRQQITPPEGTAMAGVAADGGGEQSSGSSGGLTGEGEVRIIIRPAPSRDQRSQAWPMPPGREGQTYSFFVEENSGQPTAETTPADPRAWSIASEWGGSASPEADGSRRNSAVPSSNVLGSRRESRDMSARNSGQAGSSFFEAASTATWMTQGQRPSGSSQGGFGTRLAPPPPTHTGAGRGGPSGEGPGPSFGRGNGDGSGQHRSSNGNGNRGGNGNGNGGGPRYNYGSIGIGRAV